MPNSTDHLNTRVVVRRMGVGTAPFAWEIQGSSSTVARYVSFDRFHSMEAAYAAGQARLLEFLPPKPVKQKNTSKRQAPTVTDDHNWQSDKGGLDEADQDSDADVCTDVESRRSDQLQAPLYQS